MCRPCLRHKPSNRILHPETNLTKFKIVRASFHAAKGSHVAAAVGAVVAVKQRSIILTLRSSKRAPQPLVNRTVHFVSLHFAYHCALEADHLLTKHRFSIKLSKK